MKALINILVALGLPIVAATALAVLLVEATPLSLSELSKKTGYAKSHLSPQLRMLAFNGLVEIIRKRRQVLYKARHEAFIDLIHGHLSDLQASLEQVAHRINDEAFSHNLKDIASTLKDLIKYKRGENKWNSSRYSKTRAFM